ncbi:MAG: tetratricopeptide repeat protein [Elusimicrobiota bacterium]
MKKHILILTLLFSMAAVSRAAETADISMMLELGDFNGAAAAIQSLKSAEDRHIWQSRIYFYQGDYLSAAKEMAFLENSGDNRKLQNFYIALVEYNKNSQTFESSHFILRASDNDVILSSYALTALESAYEKIGASIGCYPADKILVEIYSNKEGFAAASTLGIEIVKKSGTVGICKFNRLMMLSPEALPLGFRWLDTLAHEYTHLIVNRKSSGKCPLWLHEGIARYHDTLWRLNEPLYMSPDGENHLYDARKNNKFISFKRMYPSLVYLDTQDDMSLAFAEVSSAVKFMTEEYGGAAVGSLLENIASAKDDKSGFKKALGLSQESFEGKWKKYLAGAGLHTHSGIMSDQPRFSNFDENEFIGADLKGHIRLGDKMRADNLFEAAIAQYDKALQQEPSNPVVLLKIARALNSAGRIDAAELRLKEAVDANPGYVTPYQVLGELYYGQKRYDEAARILNEAVSINPFHPLTHELLALSYNALGASAKAEMEYRIAATLKEK